MHTLIPKKEQVCETIEDDRTSRKSHIKETRL
jgi:hypothetical protein